MTGLSFDVIGAEGPKRYFETLTPQTLAHAYLFSGAAGVGKKTFARRIAQSLLCKAPKEGVLGYDGTCASCILFGAGDDARHPDFLEHVGALKIGDPGGGMGFYEGDDLTARDLVRQLSMQSYSGGMRLLLLGDVDFPTAPAANALLKFLEEPPAGVLAILTSAMPGRLLSTIRSRLLDVRFPLLTKAELRDLLRQRGYDDSDAELGSSLGRGSIARALAALDRQGESLRAQVAEWFFDSVEGRMPEGAWATRETLSDGLETVKTLVRDWILAGPVGRDVPLVSIDYAARLRRLPLLGGAEAVAVLAKIDDAARLARTNVNPTMVSEIVRMALTRRSVTKSA